MRYKGDEVADSSFIIEYIEKAKHIDPNEGLSIGDAALSRAFTKLIETSTAEYVNFQDIGNSHNIICI